VYRSFIIITRAAAMRQAKMFRPFAIGFAARSRAFAFGKTFEKFKKV
jgi:hypothetical protein